MRGYHCSFLLTVSHRSYAVFLFFASEPYLNFRYKENINSLSVLRPLVYKHLSGTFPNHLLIYTDASVDHRKNSATVAVIYPVLGYEWKRRLPLPRPRNSQLFSCHYNIRRRSESLERRWSPWPLESQHLYAVTLKMSARNFNCSGHPVTVAIKETNKLTLWLRPVTISVQIQ